MVNLDLTIDNTDEVLAEMQRQIDGALEAIGNQAVSHAKQNITQAGRIDTGAMINSITHQVEDDICYVGTNNEYAIYHEYGTGVYAEGGKGRKTPWMFQDHDGEWHWTRGIKPIHFLKNAILNYAEEYKSILKQHLGI
jgi:phage gpG-like protein